MGMQERVDCDDNWGEEGSHHRCRPGESVVCDDEGEAGGRCSSIQKMLGEK